MKKFIAMTLIMLMVLTLFTACGNQTSDSDTISETSSSDNLDTEETTSTSSADETLVVCIAEEPTTLIKTIAEIGSSALYISSCMVDPMLWYDTETGEISSNVCTEYEWIDDLHFQLTIRDDIIAHDGTPITSEDVYYTLQIATDSGISDVSMIDINECSIVDDYTVIIGLNTPYATFVDKLCNDGFLTIVSKSAVEAVGGLDAAARNPKVFTGPYIFDEWVEGQYIRLVRNDNYWDKENAGYYKYIEFNFVSDAATRAMALQSGDVDVAIGLTNAQDSLVENDPNITAAYGTALNNKLIYFNNSIEPLNDVRVREALWKLVDVDALIAVCENGMATACETVLSPVSTMYDVPDDFTREVDVEGAKALLAEAGYSDGFSIELLVESADSTGAELVSAQLAEAGITVTISVVESVTIQTRIADGDYELAYTASYHSDPARVLNRFDSSLFYTTTGGGGFFYESDELDELVAAAKAALDDTERKEIYAELQAYVRDNYLVIGLYGGLTRHAVRSDITGFQYNLPGNLLIRFLHPSE